MVPADLFDYGLKYGLNALDNYLNGLKPFEDFKYSYDTAIDFSELSKSEIYRFINKYWINIFFGEEPIPEDIFAQKKFIAGLIEYIKASKVDDESIIQLGKAIQRGVSGNFTHTKWPIDDNLKDMYVYLAKVVCYCLYRKQTLDIDKLTGILHDKYLAVYIYAQKFINLYDAKACVLNINKILYRSVYIYSVDDIILIYSTLYSKKFVTPFCVMMMEQYSPEYNIGTFNNVTQALMVILEENVTAYALDVTLRSYAYTIYYAKTFPRIDIKSLNPWYYPRIIKTITDLRDSDGITF